MVFRHEFDSEQIPDLTKDVYIQDIHCVGSLCKLYFRELPNPLLTYQLYEKFSVSPPVACTPSALLPPQSGSPRCSFSVVWGFLQADVIRGLRNRRDISMKTPPCHYESTTGPAQCFLVVMAAQGEMGCGWEKKMC